MFTDAQLKNFSRYLSETPKHLLGAPEAGSPFGPRPSGAYDAIRGASAHGFGMSHRRARLARDAAPAVRPSEVLARFAESLSPEGWAHLGAILRGEDQNTTDEIDDVDETAVDEMDPRGGELETRGGALDPRGMDGGRRKFMSADFAKAFPYASTIRQA